jgi:hypothetical protein
MKNKNKDFKKNNYITRLNCHVKVFSKVKLKRNLYLQYQDTD